ncbi:hypothetical protein [Pseudomonas parakoreensis]|uniref:hypothetical protein n=1 Tax=Pseudomonas parakoreensis TaxID=2892331 RepID=UPI003FD698A0
MAASKLPAQQNASNGGSALLLDEPAVPAVLDENDPVGLLPLAALGQDLVVEFMGWDFTVVPNRTDLVELGFTPLNSTFVCVNEHRYPSPVTNLPLPQTLTVPRGLLNQGVYDVSIRVSPSLQNPTESPRKRITIDTTKPDFGNEPKAGIFPAELNGTLTEAYLSRHGQVIIEVPFYTDVAAKDRAVYFWTDKNPPPSGETEIREQEFSEQDIIDQRLLVTVYADEIRPWKGGRRFFYYKLRDRAGNTGPISELAPILVDLTPLPGTLPPPRVELPRNLIDRQQARDGVLVEIDPYDFPDSGHRVAVLWDGTPLVEVPVDPSDFPQDINVPWNVLQKQGDGPLRAVVSYRIRLADGSYTPPSPSISVAVNLKVAGQDHPRAPALLNEILARLEVRGQISDQPNKLVGLDYGLPARALLTLYDNPQPLETIDVYWGAFADPVASYEVKFGDVAGQPLDIEIPWEYIEPDLQNSKLPVHYVTRNGVNDQLSRVTEVDVSMVVFSDLKEVEFPHAGRERVLHCCSVPRLWDGVTVHIPPDPRFTDKDEITLFWQGCRGPNGSDPIAGVYAEIIKELDPVSVVNGLEVVVDDYETLIAPMVNRGSALVRYVLNKRDGGIGRSRPEFVVINRTMPSGEICSPENEVDCSNFFEMNKL